MTAPVGFSIGGNIGDKIATIKKALALLDACDGLSIERISSFYRTEPWGVKDQDWFVNICATGRTSLAPDALLAAAQSVEKALGRKKTVRWGPRLIDVDILFYGTRSIDIPNLTIPHKSIAERAFVLVPLQEIAPDFDLDGTPIADLIARLGGEADEVIAIAS